MIPADDMTLELGRRARRAAAIVIARRDLAERKQLLRDQAKRRAAGTEMAAESLLQHAWRTKERNQK